MAAASAAVVAGSMDAERTLRIISFRSSDGCSCVSVLKLAPIIDFVLLLATPSSVPPKPASIYCCRQWPALSPSLGCPCHRSDAADVGSNRPLVEKLLVLYHLMMMLDPGWNDAAQKKWRKRRSIVNASGIW